MAGVYNVYKSLLQEEENFLVQGPVVQKKKR